MLNLHYGDIFTNMYILIYIILQTLHGSILWHVNYTSIMLLLIM